MLSFFLGGKNTSNFVGIIKDVAVNASSRDIMERGSWTREVAVDGNENDKGWFMVVIKKKIFHSSIQRTKKRWKMIYECH